MRAPTKLEIVITLLSYLERKEYDKAEEYLRKIKDLVIKESERRLKYSRNRRPIREVCRELVLKDEQLRKLILEELTKESK